jgi:ferredoxin-NADP reductase
MRKIGDILNSITMYRLVVYALALLSALAVIFSFMERLSATPTEMVASLLLLITTAYVTDRGFGRYFKVPTNMESSLITALILFLIIQPASSVMTVVALVLAGAISSASKFLITWHGKHIFNPAAFAAAVVSLTGLQPTTWWIGNSVFWPFMLVIGLAVVYKIRRFSLVITFVVTSIVLQAALFLANHQPFVTNLKHALIASPLLFLASIMLTEPATMPPRRKLQMVFGAIVAVFYITAWKLGPLIIYPEVALLIGNIFAFIVSPKLRVRMELAEVKKISDRVFHYEFVPDHSFRYRPGQYMEWTLPNVSYDSRGNRRTLTIASSPTEDRVQLGIKYYDPASMYKAAFAKLQPGDVIYASQLAGDFTLGSNLQRKLVFIAGGIGITPFRSMLKYITDTKTSSDIVLVYAVSDPAEFAYVSELNAAIAYGVRVLPIVTNPDKSVSGAYSGKISAELLTQKIPDFAERIFYISGPNAMVDASKTTLQGLGIPVGNIKTDHFSGY